MYSVLAVSGYRSLRDVCVPLGRLTVVTGPNGSGKSSLYRALRLLADCGQGQVVASLAREGGLQSALWAGPASLAGARRTGQTQGTVRKGPISLRLGVGGELGYLVDLGLPQQSPDARSFFLRDPEINREAVVHGAVMRPGHRADRVRRHRVHDVHRALQPRPPVQDARRDESRADRLERGDDQRSERHGRACTSIRCTVWPSMENQLRAPSATLCCHRVWVSPAWLTSARSPFKGWSRSGDRDDG